MSAIVILGADLLCVSCTCVLDDAQDFVVCASHVRETAMPVVTVMAVYDR